MGIAHSVVKKILPVLQIGGIVDYSCNEFNLYFLLGVLAEKFTFFYCKLTSFVIKIYIYILRQPLDINLTSVVSSPQNPHPTPRQTKLRLSISQSIFKSCT